MPDAKEALRKEMQKKEAKRAARAKKALGEFEARRATYVLFSWRPNRLASASGASEPEVYVKETDLADG